MANRFWVGGTGTWDVTSTTHWSTTSGGAGGATAPSVNDDVIFDVNSFSADGQTVTTSGVAVNCKTLSFSTITHLANLDLGCNLYVKNGTTTLSNKLTISMAGFLLGLGATFDGGFSTSGASYSFDLTVASWIGGGQLAIYITAGATVNMAADINFSTQNIGIISDVGWTGVFNTNNFNITAEYMTVYGTGSNSVVTNLGTSTITLYPLFSSQTLDFSFNTLNGNSSTVDIFTTTSVFTIQGYTSGTGLGTVNIHGTQRVTIENQFENSQVYDIQTLNLDPGSSLQGAAGCTIHTVNFNAVGISVDPITISSTGLATFIYSDNPVVAHVNVSFNTALGATPFGDTKGVDGGNNTGWAFSPVASFSGTPTTGNVSLVTSFTDTSTNTPTSWLWDFGDGSTSILQNPTHTFVAPGVYTVTLTVTNAADTSTITQIAYIHAQNGLLYLQNVFMIGSDTTGIVQMLNVGKDDNGTPIFYELETQELEFANLSHLKGVSDEIVVFTNFGAGSKLQAATDTQGMKDVDIDLSERVNFGKSIDIEGHFVTFRWFGVSATVSPLLEGFYLENVIDKGMTQP